MRYDKFLKIERPPRAEGAVAKAARHARAAPLPIPGETFPAFDALAEWLVLQDAADGRPVRISQKEFHGEFNFRDTILDQLETYFVYIKRMRKMDREAYGLYRKVGATLLPYVALGVDRIELQFQGKVTPSEPKIGPPDKLPAAFRQIMPTFGCFAYGADPITERVEKTDDEGKTGKMGWIPKFLYFLKCDKPSSAMQSYCGATTTYKVTVWWDRPYDKSIKRIKGGGVPQDYAVAITPDGSVHALKLLKSAIEKVKLKRRGKHHAKRREIAVRSRQWVLPHYFDVEKGDTQRFALERLFIHLANWHEGSAMSTFRVSVSRGDLTATFALNPLRAAYFFADRKVEVTTSGHARPIFHFVRPHTRADGSLVKAHFRGQRQFKWGDYDVLITVPGLHHPDLATIDLATVDEEHLTKEELKTSYQTLSGLGKKLRSWIHLHDDAQGATR
jgi:hypothetical protein